MTSTRRHLASLMITLLACGPQPAAETKQTDTQQPQPEPDAGPVLPPFPPLQHTTVLPDDNPDPAVVEVTLRAQAVEHIYSGVRATQVWAYNGMVPGPTIQARVGDRIIVHFGNELPEATTIHWHGLRITPEMDGDPHHVPVIEPGGMFTYDFVVPDAGSFWFHPHYNSVEQIERGLMGTLVVHEADPPVFDTERIFFTDDVKLSTNGQLAPFATAGPDIMHGRSGNRLLLNGREENAPITVAAGTRERWRLYNGSNGRTMSLSLEGARFQVIGTDGGLLPAPYTVERLVVAIGQRYDLDVVFDGEPGSTATLYSHVLTLDANNQVVEVPIAIQTFTYDGAPAVTPRDVQIPWSIQGPWPSPIRADKTLVLSGFNDNGTVRFSINGFVYPDEEHWATPLGDLQVEIRNELGMEHPFHIHGQFFEIMRPLSLAAREPGLKDTVLVPGAGSVTLLMHFTNPGSWMYHCHIPEHADRGMMGHVHVGD